MKAKVGDKEHMLLVLDIERKGKYKYYHCLCDCGNETLIRSDSFGKTRSCGCLKKEKQFKKKDLTNQKFGMLVVKNLTGEKSGNSYMWTCHCDCGNSVDVAEELLTTKKKWNCGCQNKSVRYNLGKKASDRNKELYSREGTNLEKISKTHLIKTNTSGTTGVYFHEKNKNWYAQIKLKGVAHHLGTFENKAAAIAARKEAEEKFFKPILEKYKEPTLKSDKKTGKFIANTKEELLHDLKRVAPSDKILTRIHYNENGKYNSQTFVIRFGSWDAALKEAGLPRSRNYSREELIEILKELEKTLGRRPSTNDLKFPYPTFHVFQQEFQTFTNALVVAGLLEGSPIDDEALEKKKENLISKMNHIIANINRPARQVDFSNAILYSARNLFGSYKNAAIAAGFYEPTNKYTREEIAKRLSELAITLDRLPNKQDIIDGEGLPNPSTIPRYFGTKTLSEAMHLVLYEYESSKQYSNLYNKKDFENQLTQKMEELGRIPKWKELQEDKRFPGGAIMKICCDGKSWKKYSRCILEKKLIACLKIILNQNSQKEG